jgi:hypothetical protein
MSSSHNKEATITVDRDHLEAILENCEFSVRFAEAFLAGDPLDRVPLWATVVRIREELGFPLDPLAPEPLAGLASVRMEDESHVVSLAVFRLVHELREQAAEAESYPADDFAAWAALRKRALGLEEDVRTLLDLANSENAGCHYLMEVIRGYCEAALANQRADGPTIRRRAERAYPHEAPDREHRDREPPSRD